jgi:hypothetical protein
MITDRMGHLNAFDDSKSCSLACVAERETGKARAGAYIVSTGRCMEEARHPLLDGFWAASNKHTLGRDIYELRKASILIINTRTISGNCTAAVFLEI